MLIANLILLAPYNTKGFFPHTKKMSFRCKIYVQKANLALSELHQAINVHFPILLIVARSGAILLEVITREKLTSSVPLGEF